VAITFCEAKDMEISEEFLSELETAKYLGITKATLVNWACAKKGPPRIKVGRQAFYRREALTAWMQSRERSYEPAAASGRRR
jgi:predicted DNA-binding transcriptional regulator AlpA